jgi:elongation factor G
LIYDQTKNKKPFKLNGLLIPKPVFFCSIEVDSAEHQKKIEDTLKILQLEDPSFFVKNDPLTGQTLLR